MGFLYHIIFLQNVKNKIVNNFIAEVFFGNKVAFENKEWYYKETKLSKNQIPVSRAVKPPLEGRCPVGAEG